MALSGVGQERRAADLPPRQLLALRGNTFGILAMLIVQFAIGIVVNLYATVPAKDKGSGIFDAIGSALSSGPASLATHAGLGLLIVLTAVALVVRSIIARHTASIVLSVLGLAAIASAALNGARFVADGGPANASLAMALSTAAAMLSYATGLLLLGFSRAIAGLAHDSHAAAQLSGSGWVKRPARRPRPSTGTVAGARSSAPGRMSLSRQHPPVRQARTKRSGRIIYGNALAGGRPVAVHAPRSGQSEGLAAGQASYLLPRLPASHACWLFSDDVRARARILVADLDQDPALLPGPRQPKAARKLSAVQDKRHMARLVTHDLGGPLIPNDHRAGSAFLAAVNTFEISR
jgi:hypothetical protein